MADLGRNQFPEYAKLTRLAKGRRQMDLAQAIGVSATALCRYEQGDEQTLGDASIGRLCDALELDRPAWLAPPRDPSAEENAEGLAPERGPGVSVDYYCATPGCVLNMSYVIGTVFRYLPTPVPGPPDRDICCPYCRSMLRQVCFICNTPFRRGAATCSACTTPYVEERLVTSETTWAETWNREFQTHAFQPSGVPTSALPIDLECIAVAQQVLAEQGAGCALDGGSQNGVAR